MNTKAPKRGRPPKPRNKRASEFISLRVTPPEKQTLTKAADRADKPLPTWAKDTLLTAANTPAPTGAPINRPHYAVDPEKVGKLTNKEKSEMTQ